MNFTKKQQKDARVAVTRRRHQQAYACVLKLNELGVPSRLDEGFAVIAERIRVRQPELAKVPRKDIFAAYLGDEEYKRLRAKAHAIKKARKQARPGKAPGFYFSREWREVRYQALKLHGGSCQCCGITARDGAKLHVDHIKPRSKFPELELEVSNLQVLCEDCNLGKSNKDSTDWRPSDPHPVHESR